MPTHGGESGVDWRSSRLREVSPPIKANDVKPFIFMISTFRKKPWFRHEIEKTILCRILRNCVALSSGNAAACYLPDVTVACRHLKLRGGGTPNCLFSKRYWRMPTRDRRYGDHSLVGTERRLCDFRRAEPRQCLGRARREPSWRTCEYSLQVDSSLSSSSW